MRILDFIQKTLKLFIPPIVIKAAQWAKSLYRQPLLEYAPDGWQTQLDKDRHQGWNVDSVIDTEKAKWDRFCRNLKGPGPLGFSHEHSDLTVIHDTNFHNVHISYAYVLALTAHQKERISVLDWGGSLGHYYLVGKAVLPGVSLDYHVKEVPLMAKAGRQLNPDVNWYDDECCLEREYDLVMLNGSILYSKDWAEKLQKISLSAKKYLFLFRLPVVQNSPTFISIERLHHSQMLHQQVNQAQLLAVAKKTGMSLVREFVVGTPPYIKNAPEQCQMRGWLLKKTIHKFKKKNS